MGKSENFVCEACEFVDTFLELSPAVAVILNIDEDHLDYFKTLDNLIHSFHKFADMATDAVIYNGDDQNTRTAMQGVGEKTKITFGFSKENNYYPENISDEHGAFYAFDVCRDGEKARSLSTGNPGRAQRAQCFGRCGRRHARGRKLCRLQKGIETFHGAGRRFENSAPIRASALPTITPTTRRNCA